MPRSISYGVFCLDKIMITVLRLVPPGGEVRAFEFDCDPALVRIDPRWHQGAMHLVNLGFFQFHASKYHIVFLFFFVIPFLRLRDLILVVTAFFFFNYTASTEFYTLSLHDALPICHLSEVIYVWCYCWRYCFCS